jgi:hypothetical protein
MCGRTSVSSRVLPIGFDASELNPGWAEPNQYTATWIHSRRSRKEGVTESSPHFCAFGADTLASCECQNELGELDLAIPMAWTQDVLITPNGEPKHRNRLTGGI